jgi:hypothetical protein
MDGSHPLALHRVETCKGGWEWRWKSGKEWFYDPQSSGYILYAPLLDGGSVTSVLSGIIGNDIVGICSGWQLTPSFHIIWHTGQLHGGSYRNVPLICRSIYIWICYYGCCEYGCHDRGWHANGCICQHSPTANACEAARKQIISTYVMNISTTISPLPTSC